MTLFSNPQRTSYIYHYTVDINKPLFYVTDTDHLLKNIRNIWINQKKQLDRFFPLISMLKISSPLHQISRRHLLMYMLFRHEWQWHDYPWIWRFHRRLLIAFSLFHHITYTEYVNKAQLSYTESIGTCSNFFAAGKSLHWNYCILSPPASLDLFIFPD